MTKTEITKEDRARAFIKLGLETSSIAYRMDGYLLDRDYYRDQVMGAMQPLIKRITIANNIRPKDKLENEIFDDLDKLTTDTIVILAEVLTRLEKRGADVEIDVMESNTGGAIWD